MMRYLAIGTVAAVLAGGGMAMAQMPPGGDGPHGPMSDEHMDEQRGMMEHWHHRRPFMSEGSLFRFKRGDDEVVIRCTEREPVQACVNGAATLLDKLNSSQAAPKPAQ